MARRTQPRIPGTHRQPVSSAIETRIERRLSQTMARFDVSRSFVIAVALAAFFGIELDEAADYRRQPRPRAAAARRKGGRHVAA